MFSGVSLIEDSSLLVSKRGEAESSSEFLGCCLRRSGVAGLTFLCDFPTWIFKPFSDLKMLPHWSHLTTFSSRVLSSSFFFTNSFLLLASLFKVDGVFFFALEAIASFPLVSREKEKLFPRVKVKEKVSDLPANVWQKSRHWDTRAELSSFTIMAVIFSDYF